MAGQIGQLGLIEHRAVEVQYPSAGGLGAEGRPALAQVHLQAHHQLFAQRVDRRVRHLCEALLEVVVEEVGLGGEHRQGNVVAHAVGGLLAGPGHVLDHQIQVFGGETEGALLLEQFEVGEAALLRPGTGGQVAAIGGEPGAIGVAGCALLLHLPVAQHPPLLQIDRQHLARTEAALFDDAAFLQFHHAGFRAHHHVAIAGDAVAGGPQAIAIEGGPHHAAIAEHQQGRAIPGFLQTSIVFVKVFDRRESIELRLVAEGLRHQGEQAVGDRPAAAHHQFEGGIEVGGIAEGGIHQGPQVGGGIAPDGLEIGLGGTGPVDVAQQGVDLAVVAEQPHRLGQGPAGQGVGAEAAVVHRETHREAFVAQIGVEAIQYLGTHHAFVHNRAGADRGEIKVADVAAPCLAGAVHGAAPQAE